MFYRLLCFSLPYHALLVKNNECKQETARNGELYIFERYQTFATQGRKERLSLALKTMRHLPTTIGWVQNIRVSVAFMIRTIFQLIFGWFDVRRTGVARFRSPKLMQHNSWELTILTRQNWLYSICTSWGDRCFTPNTAQRHYTKSIHNERRLWFW